MKSLWNRISPWGTPMILIAVGGFLLWSHFSKAGKIRQLELTEDHPGTVVLALGRSTAISFYSRPEKVVPGSPQSIQINFLGNDLTITPMNRKPGNLLVYTKSVRYVILFRIGNDADYDDVVRVGMSGRARAVQLLTDSFRAVIFLIESKGKDGTPPERVPASVTVLVSSNELEITGPDLKEVFTQGSSYHCSGCVLRMGSDQPRILCSKPITEIRCQSKSTSIAFKRVAP